MKVIIALTAISAVAIAVDGVSRYAAIATAKQTLKEMTPLRSGGRLSLTSA